MTKVDELVEWVARQLYYLNGKNDKLWSYWTDNGDTQPAYRRIAKQILSHPDLALIDREYNGTVPLDRVAVVIPLTEALKEQT